MHLLNKKSLIRANEASFMDKELKKSIMKRSRLRNRYLMLPSQENKIFYKIQRNVCTKLLRKRKRSYYNKLDTKYICDNKKFWNTVKPLFSDKINASHKISLIDDNNIISENREIAEIFNDFFSTAATNLEIDKSEIYITEVIDINDPIFKAIKKYEMHPSIKKITESISITEKFNFSSVSCDDMKCIVNDLDISKATVYSSIPTKVFKQNFDICSDIITNMYNNSTIAATFPLNMKYADVSPVHKKDDYSNKKNYRPVSLLPIVSKVFERLLSNKIYSYIEKYLSTRLCGFRNYHIAQLSLIIMLEEIRKI